MFIQGIHYLFSNLGDFLYYLFLTEIGCDEKISIFLNLVDFFYDPEWGLYAHAIGKNMYSAIVKFWYKYQSDQGAYKCYFTSHVFADFFNLAVPSVSLRGF